MSLEEKNRKKKPSFKTRNTKKDLKSRKEYREAKKEIFEHTNR